MSRILPEQKKKHNMPTKALVYSASPIHATHKRSSIPVTLPIWIATIWPNTSKKKHKIRLIAECLETRVSSAIAQHSRANVVGVRTGDGLVSIVMLIPEH